MALFIDLHLSLLDHLQALHAQNVGLQESRFGLQAGLQISDILNVRCARYLLTELIDTVDAFGGGVVNLLAEAHLPGVQMLDARELLGVEVISVGTVSGIALKKLRSGTAEDAGP